MLKRKSFEVIQVEVNDLVTKAKQGSITGTSASYNCGGGLYVIVNRGTGKAAWYARVNDKKILLGDYASVNYETASEKISALQDNEKIVKEEKASCPTVLQYLDPFLEEMKTSRNLGKISCNNFKILMKTTLYPLHDYKLCELTRDLIVSNIKMIEQTPNNKHLAVNLLNNMLRCAYEKGLIPFNPISDLLSHRDSPFPKQGPAHRDPLSADDFITKVVKPLAKASSVYQPVYLMCFLTGFRFSEFSQMRWTLIDFETKTLKLPVKSLTGKHTDKYFIKPITEPMLELLQYLKSKNAIQSDFVFQSPSKRRPAAMSDNAIREPWRQLVSSDVCDFDGIKLTMQRWFKDQIAIDPISGFARPMYPADVVEDLFSRSPRYAVNIDAKPTLCIEPVRSILNAWDQWLVKRLPLKFVQFLTAGRALNKA